MLRSLLTRVFIGFAVAAVLFIGTTWLDLRTVANKLYYPSVYASEEPKPASDLPLHLFDIVREPPSTSSKTSEFSHTSTARKLRLAIGDSHTTGHDEVLAPLLYSLSTISEVEVTVFRNQFREGFREVVQAWYQRPFYSFHDLFDSKTPSLNETDILILNTADRDLDKLAESNIVALYPGLRIIAVAHRSNRFRAHGGAPIPTSEEEGALSERALGAIAKLQRDKRLSFLVLAPNVQASLSRALSGGILDGAEQPLVRVFVPIMPLERKPPTMARRRLLQSAVIQGTLISWSRNYSSVFSSLERRLKKYPERWGYNGRPSSAYREDTSSRTQPFKLMLVGHKDEREDLHIPASVRNVVQLYTDVPYPEYYQQIGQADILIPAFHDQDMYLHHAASSSIPAAIMARIPTLASQAEMEAYSYLRGPAIVLRKDGEDEMIAIARLRREKTNVWSSASEWLAYETSLLRANRATLVELLGLPEQ